MTVADWTACRFHQSLLLICWDHDVPQLFPVQDVIFSYQMMSILESRSAYCQNEIRHRDASFRLPFVHDSGYCRTTVISLYYRRLSASTASYERRNHPSYHIWDPSHVLIFTSYIYLCYSRISSNTSCCDIGAFLLALNVYKLTLFIWDSR